MDDHRAFPLNTSFLLLSSQHAVSLISVSVSYLWARGPQDVFNGRTPHQCFRSEIFYPFCLNPSRFSSDRIGSRTFSFTLRIPSLFWGVIGCDSIGNGFGNSNDFGLRTKCTRLRELCRVARVVPRRRRGMGPWRFVRFRHWFCRKINK